MNRLKMRKSEKGYLALKLLTDKTRISIPASHKESREKQGRGKL